jgi:hypothetical protein
MTDDLVERRSRRASASDRAAPVTLDPEAFAKALVAAQRVTEQPSAASLPPFVRCKVRVRGEDGAIKYRHLIRDRDGFPALSEEGRPVIEWRDVTIKFGPDELKDPREADRPFKFGETVYLKREAYQLHASAGNVVIGQ